MTVAIRYETKYSEYRRFVRLCEAQGKDPASVIHSFIQRYIEEHKETAKKEGQCMTSRLKRFLRRWIGHGNDGGT